MAESLPSPAFPVGCHTHHWSMRTVPALSSLRSPGENAGPKQSSLAGHSLQAKNACKPSSLGTMAWMGNFAVESNPASSQPGSQFRAHTPLSSLVKEGPWAARSTWELQVAAPPVCHSFLSLLSPPNLSGQPHDLLLESSMNDLDLQKSVAPCPSFDCRLQLLAQRRLSKTQHEPLHIIR